MSKPSCFLLGVMSGAVTVALIKIAYERLTREDAERLLDQAHRQLEQLERRILSASQVVPA